MPPRTFTDDIDPLLSHADAAAYLGLRHQQTLHNLKSQGIGPRQTKIRGSRGSLYRMSDLLVWQLDRYLAKVAKAVAS
ncbi:hypothetical protein [Mesorhizobium sp.]|uniref:hypothetical protein n=1 Tax=Mesorhizobium sp. TaxID=1871066 RepID=UPI000FE50E80|nr:hypothetical protein [Mesorhizobium sp.]RWD70196.1 MAG: hypothetical protein EOS37_15450 [Mesorhizobium sp.]